MLALRRKSRVLRGLGRKTRGDRPCWKHLTELDSFMKPGREQKTGHLFVESGVDSVEGQVLVSPPRSHPFQEILETSTGPPNSTRAYLHMDF